MDTNDVIGWVAWLVGLAFVFIGLYSAYRQSERPAEVATEVVLTTTENPASAIIEAFAKLIEAISKLVETLSKAQFWLATTAVGAFFIAYGTWVLKTVPF